MNVNWTNTQIPYFRPHKVYATILLRKYIKKEILVLFHIPPMQTEDRSGYFVFRKPT